MAKKGKRQKIDWENIKITIVLAEKNNPNAYNPCCSLSKAEREKRIVSIAARIWVKDMKKEMSKATDDFKSLSQTGG